MNIRKASQRYSLKYCAIPRSRDGPVTTLDPFSPHSFLRSPLEPKERPDRLSTPPPVPLFPFSYSTALPLSIFYLPSLLLPLSLPTIVCSLWALLPAHTSLHSPSPHTNLPTPSRCWRPIFYKKSRYTTHFQITGRP